MTTIGQDKPVMRWYASLYALTATDEEWAAFVAEFREGKPRPPEPAPPVANPAKRRTAVAVDEGLFAGAR